MLRDSTTRRLVVLGGHDLHVPEYLFHEIDAHRVELVTRHPSNLYERLLIVNEADNLMNRLPSEADVEKWINQAKDLPRKVQY